MKFNTKRYTITKVNPEEFNEGIKYEINLTDGYVFSDGSHLAYASSTEDLSELIAEIEVEK